ncbi:hypothetical protein ACKUB1_01145 [Methanospirillum stamsii]|uniref:Uncharacterized protein n=1 Tax=Methanospirillum stamsii TaxID=1277351 RepID=A0A2V2N459_9EURY|nr:hypothetical protein [Methanospirillum stamsii]PWR74599.1 hypothetical protein DLD82_08430 [Methanospirillum stamsii]
MRFEKLNKKLPEDILSVIDEEAAAGSITRQEAVSKLVRSVISIKHESENEQLKYQIKELNRQIAIKDDEVTYLRNELHALNAGLSKLAENIVVNNAEKNDFETLLTPIKQDVSSYSDEIKNIREKIENCRHSPFENHIPLIIIGIIASLLIIYLIISTLSG